MQIQTHFMTESPDFNFMIEEGLIERIAANRVIVCIMTEFGMMNNKIMDIQEFSQFIKSIQTTVTYRRNV